MSAISTSFTLLMIGVLPWTLGYTCLPYPVRYLENGCIVRNLTVRDARNHVIIDDCSCGATVYRQAPDLDWPYNVNFSRNIGPEFQHSSFLLVVIDHTWQKLLWMVANITVPPYERRLDTVRGYYNSPSTLKAYERPILDSGLHDHRIEFLVFQQSKNFPTYAPIGSAPGQQSHQPFNLLQWFNEQARNGHRFCGPVAGAMVHMYYGGNSPPSYSSHQQPSHCGMGNTYPPTYQPPYGRNAALRITRNKSLLTATACMALLLYCMRR